MLFSLLFVSCVPRAFAGHETRSHPENDLLAVDGDYGEDAVTLADAHGFEIGQGIHVASKRAGGFHTICATILNKEGNYLTLSRSFNADCMMADEAYAATVFPVISAYEVADCRIENLAIDGNRGKNEVINGRRGAGIFCYRADGAVFENCIVREYNGDGISFQQSKAAKKPHSESLFATLSQHLRVARRCRKQRF